VLAEACLYDAPEVLEVRVWDVEVNAEDNPFKITASVTRGAQDGHKGLHGASDEATSFTNEEKGFLRSMITKKEER